MIKLIGGDYDEHFLARSFRASGARHPGDLVPGHRFHVTGGGEYSNYEVMENGTACCTAKAADFPIHFTEVFK